MGRIWQLPAATPSAASAGNAITNATYEPFGPPYTLTYGNGVNEAGSFDLPEPRCLGRWRAVLPIARSAADTTLFVWICGLLKDHAAATNERTCERENPGRQAQDGPQHLGKARKPSKMQLRKPE